MTRRLARVAVQIFAASGVALLILVTVWRLADSHTQENPYANKLATIVAARRPAAELDTALERVGQTVSGKTLEQHAKQFFSEAALRKAAIYPSGRFYSLDMDTTCLLFLDSSGVAVDFEIGRQ